LVAALCAVALVFAADAGTTHAAENGKIAFSRDQANENWDVYTVNADGSGLARLTNNDMFGVDSASDQAPTWSPDGRRILFTRVRDEDPEGSGIFTMAADGSELTQLTGKDAYTTGWLPSGRVAYVSSTPEEGLFTVRPDGSDRTRIGPNPGGGYLSWSPDGSMLVFTRGCCSYYRGIFDNDIYTGNADGSGERMIVRGGSYPVWAPGDKIAFIRDTAGGCCSGWEIYTINFDGTEETRLTHDNAFDADQTWSPDGAKLAFESDRNHKPGDLFDLFTINADGSGLRNLTPTSSGSDTKPAWSPDSRRLVFQGYEQGGQGLFTVDADGTRRARITGGGNDFSASWQPLVRSSFPNSAAFCRAHREAVGQSRFASRWGANRNGANAFGKCVSSNP
jgi:Tol biopolymer transport system component